MMDRRMLGHTREFDTPEDLRDVTFFDTFADVFTPPDCLELRRPDYGFMARVRDADRIREDFRKAIANLGLEKGDDTASR